MKGSKKDGKELIENVDVKKGYMANIIRENLSSQVYSILKEMILNQRFRPGMRVNVEQLAKHIGVSNTPVWEAVHRLIQEGLLKNIPNRGVFASELTAQAAIELYAVRGVLEGFAAQLAVQNIDDKTIKKMEQNLKEQLKVIRKGDLNGFSMLSFDFHRLVTDLCGNQILLEMLESIRNKMLPITLHIEPILPILYQEHQEILKAIKTKDPDKAGEEFRDHNRQMIEQIKESMETNSWKRMSEKNKMTYISKKHQSGSVSE